MSIMDVGSVLTFSLGVLVGAFFAWGIRRIIEQDDMAIVRATGIRNGRVEPPEPWPRPEHH